MKQSKKYIEKENNKFKFSTNLNNPNIVIEFIDLLNQSYSEGIKNILLDFESVNSAYPNICTPISGIANDLAKKNIFSFEYLNLNKYLEKISIANPFKVIENLDIAQISCLDKMWRFDSIEDAYILVDSFSKELSQVIVCQKGVLEGFEWAINEVLDNVIQHSGNNYGYVMGQVHKKTKRFMFCVVDTGNGIYKSLQPSFHKPGNAANALELAVQERVTRDRTIGQGNGLWGLNQIIKENTGRLNITSGTASYRTVNNEINILENLPELFAFSGCIVDFQLEYEKEISISKALGGYEPPVNLKIEALEDDLGGIIYPLKEKASGVGTRKSGEKMRNDLINIYNQTHQPITIDFKDINVISSSFADELIGKMVVIFGFYGYNNIFKLRNMNHTVQSIIQRSVAQRMIESY